MRLNAYFVLIFPLFELDVNDELLEGLIDGVVLIEGSSFDGVIDEVETLYGFLHLLNAVDLCSYPDSLSGVLTVMQRYIQQVNVLLHVIVLQLRLVEFLHEHRDNLRCFLLHRESNAFAFSEVVECFQHLDTLVDRRYLLETSVDDVLVHHV